MSKKLMSVTVRGKHYEWNFAFYGDPKYLAEWQADGLDVSLIENTIPLWLPNWVPVRWWCFAQDVFNLRNPWRK